ncbi:MAG: DUF6285 domain-containing protein [Thermoanaerobaculia bacterium]|nr:DUF6285 domain-containing protein [Thermoanaerobaculia bacterium]
MQDRPTAWELLDAVAELLEETLMPATEGGVRHQARVAANLCRIVQREIEGGAALEAREVELLAALLGEDRELGAEELNRRLCDRLLAGDESLERRAWPALAEIVRGKLSIAKPGYDDYDYAGEQES